MLPFPIDVEDCIPHLIGENLAVTIKIQDFQGGQCFLGWQEKSQVLKNYVIPAQVCKSLHTESAQ